MLQADDATPLSPTKGHPFHKAIAGTVMADVYQYWLAQRGDNKVPVRGDICPIGLAEALPHCLIAEPAGRMDVRLRVAGQALCALADMPLAGAAISTLFAPMAQVTLGRMARTVTGDTMMAYAPLRAKARWNGPAVGGHLMMLPLHNQTRTQTTILGVLLSDISTFGTGGRLHLARGAQPLIQPLPRKHMKVRQIATADNVDMAPQCDLPHPPQALRLVVNNA